MIRIHDWLTQSILNFYRVLGGNLFPVQKCVIGDPRSKAPLESAFYARKYDDIALQGHLDEGCGIGWCVGDEYVVMDVDYPTPERPDKRGGESLERLQNDLSINLDDVPQVHSPTGGRHYYFKRPPGLKLRKMLKEYPGIEFITGRNYVLIAGSPHWQGGHYAFDADTELLGLHPTDCPTELLDLLIKVPKPGEHKHIEPEDLEKLLSYLEPDDYSEYDDWLELAMASHSATGSAGLAEFTSWSAGGSKFSSECRVKEQWDSFDANEEGGITLATLLYRVKESVADKSDTIQEEVMTEIARIRAVNEFDDLDFEDEPDAETDDRPVTVAEKPKREGPVAIKVDPFNREVARRKVLRHLPGILRRHGIYVMDGKPVELRRSTDPDAPGSRFVEVPESKIAVVLSAAFYFFITQENKEGSTEDVQKQVPGWLPRAIREHGDYAGCDAIHAIVTTPQYLADGRLITEPGLDVETGIYLDPEPGFAMPQIPERPTRDDAQQALATLHRIVQDFPFEAPSHWAAWLSLALTILIRRAVRGCTPLFLSNGNRSGIGKSLLIQLASLISTGEEVSGNYPATDEECRKRISTAVDLKSPVELFDNIPNDGTFGHPSLDASLTATVWRDRRLGSSENIQGRVLTVMAASGINVPLDPTADIERRMVVIALDHASEADPTTRIDFTIGDADQVKEHIRANRGTYVAALLTILRAYGTSGERVDLPGFGSFDAWSRAVREPVEWITGHDPCDGIRTTALAVSEDEKSDAKALVLDAVADALMFVAGMSARDRPDTLPKNWTPESGLSSGELIQIYDDHGHEIPPLNRAMTEVLSGDGRRNSRSVGRAISRNARAVIGGRRLAQTDTNSRRAWIVESIPASDG